MRARLAAEPAGGEESQEDGEKRQQRLRQRRDGEVGVDVEQITCGADAAGGNIPSPMYTALITTFASIGPATVACAAPFTRSTVATVSPSRRISTDPPGISVVSTGVTATSTATLLFAFARAGTASATSGAASSMPLMTNASTGPANASL